MKRLISLFTLLCSSLLLSACEDGPKTPTEVSQAFWLAMENKNVDQVKKLLSSQSLKDEFSSDSIVSVSNAQLGKVIIDGSLAKVETNVTVESDKPTEVPLDTVLVKENKHWKVDYQATVEALHSAGSLAHVIRELRVLGEQFSKDLSKEFENSMNELDKAMPEIEQEIKQLGEQIKGQVPELKKQFEDLTRELQEALEGSLSEEQKPQEAI